MIHIDDIRERLLNNPEPREVTEMREHITDTFRNLTFTEDGHVYNLYDDDGALLIGDIPSASRIIHRFEQKSDWDVIAQRYAAKHGMEKEAVQRKWHEKNIMATNSGSFHHLYGETLQNLITTGDTETIPSVMRLHYEDGFLIPSAPKQNAIMEYWSDLMKIPNIYPLMAECRMYMPKGNIYGIDEVFCGTADILLAIKKGDKWCIMLHDYKTNASLTSDYNRDKGVTMLPPFTNMVDESLSHYIMQLTLYSMMLENIGYEVIDRRVIWLHDDGTYVKTNLPYIKDLVVESFKEHYAHVD